MNAESTPSPSAPPAPPLEPLPGRNPFVAALLAWLVFGLGHLYLGRAWKAAVLFVMLSALFVLGMVGSQCVFWPVDTQGYSFWVGGLGTLGSVGAGLHYMAAYVLLGPGGDLQAPAYEVGWVAVVAAGLLNSLAVLDAWDIGQRKKD